MGHETADEMNVPAEAVQLGDGDVAPVFPCGCECGLELWSAVQRVCALAGFYLDELSDNLKALSSGEVAQSCPLGLNAQARPTLLGSGNADVRDDRPVGHVLVPWLFGRRKQKSHPRIVLMEQI